MTDEVDNSAQEKSNELTREQIRLQNELSDISDKKALTQAELNKVFEDRLAKAQRLRDFNREEMNASEQRLADAQLIKDGLQEQATAYEAQLEAALKMVDASGELTEEGEKQRKLAQENLDLIKTTYQAQVDLIKEEEAASKAAADAAAKRVKAVELLGSALTSVANKAWSVGESVFTMNTDLAKSAGGAYDLKAAFEGMDTGRQWAADAAALQGLNESMSQFGQIGTENQVMLASQTALLDRLGVTATQTGALYETVMVQWGQSAEQAKNVQLELMGAAQATGIPVAKMMEDFAKAAPDLAKYGKGATKEFKKLAAQSKATGIGIDALMKATGQFDTIDDAAAAAGNLAAVLGVNVNAMEMMNMTESERVQHLKDQLAASGKNIDNMNKMEKMAAAEAMGLSVGDFEKMMRAKGDAMAKSTEEAENAAATEADLLEASEKAETMAEKRVKADEAMAGGSKAVAQGLGEIQAAILDFSAALPIVGGLLVAFVKFVGKGVFDYLMGKAKKWAEGMGGAAEAVAESGSKAMTSLGKGLGDLGKSAGKSAKGLLAVGAAILMIGIGVAIAAYGVAQLVLAFADMSPTQILAVTVALLVFGAMMVGLAIALAFAASVGAPLVLLAFGAAFLMIGGAVFLAAKGFVEILKVLPTFLKEIKGNLLTLLGFVGILYLAGPALTMAAVGLAAFGVAALIAVPGLLGLAVAMLIFSMPLLLLAEAFPRFLAGIAPYVPIMGDLAWGIGKMALAMGAAVIPMGAFAVALKLIKTDDLIAIARMAEGMSSFAKNITSEFVAAIEAIAAFVDAVDDIGSSDVEVFTRLRQEITPLLTTPVSPGIGVELGGIAKAAKDYAKANAALKVDADDDAIVALVKALKAGGGPGGGGGAAAAGGGSTGGGGNTIILQLNGREFARAVDVAINNSHDITMK